MLHTITDTIAKNVKLAVATLCVILIQVTFLSAQDARDKDSVRPSPSDIPTLPETTVQGVIPFPHDPLRIWLDNGLDAQGDPLFSNGQRFNQSLFRSPTHRSIIDLRELLERSPSDMYQAIERAAGVLVQRTQRGAAAPFIRGLTGQQVVILVDGIRMNNATFRAGPNQYFNTVDPGMVDHIEVIRGQDQVLNEPLSRIPPTQGIIGLRWRNSEKYEYLNFYAWMVRRRDRLNFQDISDNRIPNGGTPGYATFNIRNGTMLSDTQRITVELENILDQAYRVHGSGVDGAGFSANIQYSFEF